MAEKNKRVEESEFDTRSADLSILGQLLQDKTQEYRRSLKGDPEALENYLIHLKAIYRHIKYFDDEGSDKIEEIEDAIKQANTALDNRNLSRSQERTTVLERAEKVDDKINEFRKEANLAMPTKNQIDPENAAMEGL